jgi:cytochrome b subunit of formate dehydrogenase
MMFPLRLSKLGNLHSCTLLSIVAFILSSAVLFCYVTTIYPIQSDDFIELMAIKNPKHGDFYQPEWKDYRLGNVIDRWFTTPMVSTIMLYFYGIIVSQNRCLGKERVESAS